MHIVFYELGCELHQSQIALNSASLGHPYGPHMLMLCGDAGGHGFSTGRISAFEGAARVSAMFLLLSIGHCRSLMVFGATIFLVGSTVYHDQGLAYH